MQTMNDKSLNILVNEMGKNTVNINLPLRLINNVIKLIPKNTLRNKTAKCLLKCVSQFIAAQDKKELVNLETNKHGKKTKVKISVN